MNESMVLMNYVSRGRLTTKRDLVEVTQAICKTSPPGVAPTSKESMVMINCIARGSLTMKSDSGERKQAMRRTTQPGVVPT